MSINTNNQNNDLNYKTSVKQIDSITQETEQNLFFLKKIKTKNFWIGILSILLVISISFQFLLPSSKTSNLLNFNKNLESEINSIIEKSFFYELPTKEEQEIAKYKGLVSSLNDNYSDFLPKTEATDFSKSINEEYQGIGIRFSLKDKNFVIEKVFPDSPAKNSGLLEGDILLKVAGKDANLYSTSELVEFIKGELGTTVDITVQRKNQVIQKQVQRAEIKSDLISLKIENDIAIIEISSFGENLDSKMEQIAAEIINKKNEIKGIVIDLQGNSGGYLNEAIEVASYFLEPDSVVVIEKYKKTEKVLKSEKKEVTLKDFPLLVAVDGLTASASEILAASLRDNKKVSLIGRKTYGKGVVQELFVLSTGDTLKLTIAEWLSPNKNIINKNGLEPDIRTPNGFETIDYIKDQYSFK